jgi:hypothetical protein
MSSVETTNGKTKAVRGSGRKTPIPPVEPVTQTPQIAISRLAEETMLVPIIGTTPLIVHNFSEKSKRTMLDAMQGRKTPKAPKDPQAEYEAAFYRCKDESPGFPSNGFKLATVDASRFYGKDVTKVGLRQFMFIFGEIDPAMATIKGEAHMREDVVRVGQGGTDLRYRPEFPEWSTVLKVVYITSTLTRDSVLSLIDAGGMGVGIGEWRPARDGINGTYRVDPDRDIEILS